jgi:hypothetical protein
MEIYSTISVRKTEICILFPISVLNRDILTSSKDGNEDVFYIFYENSAEQEEEDNKRNNDDDQISLFSGEQQQVRREVSPFDDRSAETSATKVKQRWDRLLLGWVTAQMTSTTGAVRRCTRIL